MNGPDETRTAELLFGAFLSKDTEDDDAAWLYTLVIIIEERRSHRQRLTDDEKSELEERFRTQLDKVSRTFATQEKRLQEALETFSTRIQRCDCVVRILDNILEPKIDDALLDLVIDCLLQDQTAFEMSLWVLAAGFLGVGLRISLQLDTPLTLSKDQGSKEESPSGKHLRDAIPHTLSRLLRKRNPALAIETDAFVGVMDLVKDVTELNADAPAALPQLESQIRQLRQKLDVRSETWISLVSRSERARCLNDTNECFLIVSPLVEELAERKRITRRTQAPKREREEEREQNHGQSPPR